MFIRETGQRVDDGSMVFNGEGRGIIGEGLARTRWEPGLRRPYYRRDGEVCVTVNGRPKWNNQTGRYHPTFVEIPVRKLPLGVQCPVANATTLRKDEWIFLQKQTVLAYRQRLKAWLDLVASGGVSGFDAMAHATYEYEAMSDPGVATVDFDAMTDARHDQPLFSLRSLPLFITHSDFQYSSRRMAISQNSGQPLSAASAEAAGQRVAEVIEDQVLGNITGPSYGYVSTGPHPHDSTTKSQVYGYRTYPYRNTKTNMTAPTAGGWVPDTTYNEVLGMLDTLYADKVYGPFMIYFSTDWTQYMHRVYSVSGGNTPGATLISMLRTMDNIKGVERLDRLSATFTLLIVQMDRQTAEAINGMDITTMQWETHGGLQTCFKVMAIQVPLLKADYAGNCGIMHGTIA